MDKDIVEKIVSEFSKENGFQFINETGEGY